MKILLAVDGSEYSRKAAKFLIKQRTMLGRSPDVIVLNVDRPLGREKRAPAQPGRAVYYQQAATGFLAQAALQRQAHDDDCPAPL